MKQREQKRAGVIDKHIGSRIKKRRLTRGMSQTALAKKVGVTFQQLQKYENGSDRLAVGRFLKIAEVLKTPPSFFYKDAPGVTIQEDQVGVSAEIAEFFADLDEMRLFRALSRIKNHKLKRIFIEMIETMGEYSSE